MPAVMAGVNFVLHTAGWMEGGLAMGYEKFIMDADQAAMMEILMGGVDLSENGQAMDAIREVGPGVHFLGCNHTQNNFKTAFYRSPITDNNSYEQWESEGSKPRPCAALQRALQEAARRIPGTAAGSSHRRSPAGLYRISAKAPCPIQWSKLFRALQASASRRKVILDTKRTAPRKPIRRYH